MTMAVVVTATAAKMVAEDAVEDNNKEQEMEYNGQTITYSRLAMDRDSMLQRPSTKLIVTDIP